MRTAYLSVGNQSLGKGTHINQNIFQNKKENCTSREHGTKTYFNYSYSPSAIKKGRHLRGKSFIMVADYLSFRFHNLFIGNISN